MARMTRKAKQRWGMAVAGGLLLIALAAVFAKPRKWCEAIDGKWASTSSACITRACYALGTCGQWAYPAERCDRLHLGDSRAEVYFQLGNPAFVAHDKLVWNAGKASSDEVVALFRNDRLMRLQCGAITLRVD